MNSPTVVIVDRSSHWGFNLRERLVSSGAHVHVVNSFASALRFARTKRIDAVVVEFDSDVNTIGFCKTLAELKIPYVFSPVPEHTDGILGEFAAAV